MNANQSKWMVFLLILLPITVALAQPPGMHPGMSDEDRESMMQQRGYGYGKGEGYGYGSGAMGSMMGGQMMGMMGMGPLMMELRGLDLTKEQTGKVRKLHRDARKEQLAAMEKSMEISDKLLDLYAEEVPDASKIGAVYGELFDMRRKMIEQQIKLRNEVYSFLTKEQKDKVKDIDPYYGRHHMMGW